MPNVTIKGINEDTLKLIKRKATENNRSLNKEIIELLNRYADTRSPDPKHILKEIDKFKKHFRDTLSGKSIENAIREGRK
ncbi:MAG: hypothetical protein ABJB16_01970 [Saprospiraceae bacterium]